MKNKSYKGRLLSCLTFAIVLASCSGEDESQTNSSADEQTAEQSSSVVKADAQPKEVKSLQTRERATNPMDYRKDYGRAMKALKQEKYELATEYFTNATKGQYDEKLNMQFYGAKFEPYLPHYYLGYIAFEIYDCESAMKHWEISLNQGVIEKSPHYEYMLSSMEECNSEI